MQLDKIIHAKRVNGLVLNAKTKISVLDAIIMITIHHLH